MAVIHEGIRCSECGSSQFVQGHHISYDPEVIEDLCIYCHARKHPEKRSLILSTLTSTRKPKWNLSLHSLARRANVTAGAIVLRAQRSGILPGILSAEQEVFLATPRKGVRRTREEVLCEKLRKAVRERTPKYPFGLRLTRMSKLVCNNCSHRWYPRTATPSKQCPRCQSRHWQEVPIGKATAETA